MRGSELTLKADTPRETSEETFMAMLAAIRGMA
jgi:hypothetical protein